MRSSKITSIFENHDEIEDDHEWGLEKDEWGLDDENSEH